MSGGRARARRRLIRRPSVWIWMSLGGALVAAALELPYVNWREAAAPVDVEPLAIRSDAKGEGYFAASRSGNRRHRGVDLAAPLGSPVRAIRSGTIVQVGVHKGLGRFVEVAHRHRLRSLYAHLDTIHVDIGNRLRQGEALGTVGKTGNARHPWIVPHVHLEVWEGGEAVNPQLVGLRVGNGASGALAVSDADGGD